MQNTEATVPATEELIVPEAEQQAETEAEKATESQESAPEQSTEDKTISKMERRISKRTADYHREKARADLLDRQLAELKSGSDPQQLDPEKIDKLIEERANQRMRAALVTEKATTIEKELRKSLGAEYDDFYTDLSSSGPAARELVESVLDLDDGAKVMTHLASNRDELYEVLEMSPRKQAMHLAKLSVRLESESKAKKVSDAPKPLSPIGARTSPEGLSDDLDINEWMRRRNAKERRQ